MSRATIILRTEADRERAIALVKQAALYGRVHITTPTNVPLDVRFWSQIEFDTNGGCWLWGGNLTTNGYAHLSVDGRMVPVHRISHEMFVGPVPPYVPGGDPWVIMHLCDIPCCVNPAHLRIGRQSDNIADRFAKGRSARNAMKGSSHPQARLTEADVPAIRERLERGETYKAIAADYPVSANNIGMIARRTTWGHV